MRENENSALINQYIESYNAFNIERMLSLLDDSIVFENEANGAVNVRAEGKLEFENLAKESAKLFSQRNQTVTNLIVNDTTAQINIDYSGVLSVDLPNGMREGDELTVQGKSYFEFKNEKISYIKDVS
ncbi:nuclear transport factor 2 family protein [Pseudoalteromonas luteoviolacea]|uniref:nuclear transport factor 2 family protein n=1 Tax=Pseudoalteromonas luteoviolacea TaxID=43657 RepID=UPI001B3A2CAA|nr:nuclear transport factor 2 family protein [Pseudoalteromonas luteoviolacea]MBQ4876516.1 nuclear transport factor 2 family protein [Pseudoalteromonas luteoviolacea]MBQ4905147.1 nuclear transport factor 2 family protein [Pseudoalteromonas luteoviolacea]